MVDLNAKRPHRMAMGSKTIRAEARAKAAATANAAREEQVHPSVTEADLVWRHDGMARVLNIAVRRMQARVIARMVQRGHKDMRLALVNLTRNLDLQGTPITELARRAVMTKQAMGELADQCEHLGLVERTSDPMDRRVRVVKFTDEGLAWLTQLGEVVKETEAEMIGVIGQPAFKAVAEHLRAYNRADLPRMGPEWTEAVDDD